MIPVRFSQLELNRVVVRAVDSKCLELSIPGSNPASAFDAGGYGSI